MIIKKLATLLVAVAWGAAAPAFAGHATLSGLFDGSESQIAPLHGACAGGDQELGYQQFGPLTVTDGGTYHVVDAGDVLAVDVVVSIYQSSFDPGSPGSNLVVGEIDEAQDVRLEPGAGYIFVVQHQCINRAGAYGVAVSGPGALEGPGVVASPAYTLGEFELTDPTTDFGAGPAVYDVNGPVQVPRTGTYYYADLSVYRRVDMLLFVYREGFDPADLSRNSVGVLDDSGTIELEAGVDYYFVTTSWEFGEPGGTGEWHFALFPPGIPALNGFFSGAYFDPATSGQGVLMEVFPQIRLVFMAWFTFELQQMVAVQESLGGLPKTQQLGDASQRWLTAFGNFVPGANSVQLTFQNTTGGAFNALAPSQDRDDLYGSGALYVDDCNNITLEFDLPAGPVGGINALTRVGVDDITEAGCLEAGSQPGVIE